MVRAAIHRHHISLDSYDTVYQPDFDILCIQNRPLFDMRFQKRSDLSIFPCRLADFLRLKAIFLHRLVDRDAIFVAELLGILHITISKHCP